MPLLPVILVAAVFVWWLIPAAGGTAVTDKSRALGSTRWTVQDAERTSQPYPNELPESLLSNAVQAALLLQDIEKLGIVAHVTSWYRSEAVNSAVGGVAGSIHTQARAVDLQISNADAAMNAIGKLPGLDKAIRYSDSLAGKPSIHVEAAAKGSTPRRKLLYTADGTNYVAWTGRSNA